MKTKKCVAILLILLLLACMLTACGGSSQPAAPDAEPAEEDAEPAEEDAEPAEPEPEPAEPEEEPEPAPAADPETAMENFLAKVAAGNYVINAEALKTTVASPEQVAFEFADELYNDFAVVSVKNEVFQGFLTEEGFTDAKFLGEGTAVDVAGLRLLNAWLDEGLTDGNIWNLFYNVPEEPLKFVSHEEAVKKSLLSFVGYNENAMRLMQDVYLILDQEDPTSVRLQAVVDDDLVARISYDDIDLEVTFGNAESLPNADVWMQDPSYPEARTEWTETDEFIFNSVFLPGYGLEAIPFPPFASYALLVDEENFVMDDEVRIRDSHATEEDLAAYVAVLEENGFSAVKEEAADGSEKTAYRKLLREDYKCYSSIELAYEDGIDLTAKKYYDFPVYDDLDTINAAIGRIGYPALPASDNFTSCQGTDRADEMTESWLYFFDYDLGLYVEMAYEDQEATLAYLKEYEETLLGAGFTPDKAAEEDAEEYEESEEREFDHYESENGFASFRFHFLEDGVVTLLFKSQRYISAAEAAQLIADAGFPAIDLSDPLTCRDHKLFQKVQYGRDLDAFITVSKTFTDAEEAEAFLSSYEEALNAVGFDRENPAVVGSNKQIAIYNEEAGMLVGVDFFPEEAIVNLDFVSGVVNDSLAGTWEYRDEENGLGAIYVLNEDGTGTYTMIVGDQEVTYELEYEVQDGHLLVVYVNNEIFSEDDIFDSEFTRPDANTLIIKDSLGEELTYIRQ
ncbi:MAG: hypothetical protein IIY82_05055 [Firmicutes bacterium]|nr:hypothetical protein [Bacillota bacterium]